MTAVNTTQIGLSYSFNTISTNTALKAASPPIEPSQTAPVAVQPASVEPAHAAPQSLPATGYQPQYMMGFMSPAYLMVAPQMLMSAQMMLPQTMAYGSAPAQQAPLAQQGTLAPQGTSADSTGSIGGHVTANATNSLATTAASGMNPAMAGSLFAGAGVGAGFAGAGMAGAMAMPVGYAFTMPMMMSPLLVPVFMAYAAPFGAQAPAPTSQPNPAASIEPEAETAPSATSPAVAAPAVADQNEIAADSGNTGSARLTITELATEDFKNFKMKSISRSLESTLKLELTTKEGDKITLDFNQLDLLDTSRTRGRTLEGEKVHRHDLQESSERLVNMDVQGSLNEVERAAIEEVLSMVIEVADNFFSGSLDGALNQLRELDLNTDAIADFSLKMSMTRSVEVTRSHYKEPEGDARATGLDRIAKSDGGVMKMLEFLASEQRRLIDSASQVLDTTSSVRLVKSLLPSLLEQRPMLEQPFEELEAQIDAASDLAQSPSSEVAEDILEA